MKSFFGSFFGALFAIFLLVGIALVGFIVVIALIGISQKVPTVADNSLLVLDIALPIPDAPPEFNASQLFGGLNDEQRETPVTLRDVLRAINRAATDPKIKGIFITGNLVPVAGYASSYPALKEIREALGKFKESHKPVYAYLQFPFTLAYYLESVADQLFVDPQAEFILRGPSSSPLYYAGALKKFGVGVQVFRAGKYKSFVEPYIRENMSPENREQLEKLFGDIWREVTTTIEQARGLPPGSFEKLINENGLIDGELAVKSKLGTELVSLSQVMDRLKTQYGSDQRHHTFRQVTVSSYLSALERNPKGQSDSGSKIAVVYAEGEIVDGEGSAADVGGERYAREIRKFRLDPSVKAIVLRVNSPGGSGFASEEIYRELKAAGETKPVVVSMGGYAASGGYYISVASKHIFAEPTTITGSIGVFGLEVNFEKIAADNGITTDSVTTTNPLATLFNPLRQKSDADMAILQKAVDKFYDQFVDRVSQGRHLDAAQVNEIAQGRVWSGSEAVRIKLVDDIGGLYSAIAYASGLVHLGDQPRITEFPERKDLSEKLKELFKSTPRPPVAQFDPVELTGQEIENELKDFRALNDPEGIYARFPTGIRWN
ncbi:MAG TPA: signal peptide peptidase SppA [Chthoniobacterales bacterium]|jgi:protease-4|nr:signal peptide peptidase SppA [Chthoniobacterales bacterium]